MNYRASCAAAKVNGADLAAYCLMLGDDALIASQRLAEWRIRATKLETAVVFANIGLDLLEQARSLLGRAGAVDPATVPHTPAGTAVSAEDALAFFRERAEFRCVRLVTQDNGDFASSILRLLVFSTYRQAQLNRLLSSQDPVLAGVAVNGSKEAAYHRDYAAGWVTALARGTADSRRRVQTAVRRVWPDVGELFVPHPVEVRLTAAKVAVNPARLRTEFESVIAEVFDAAELRVPSTRTSSKRAGRAGLHSEDLGLLLADMQSVARTHPSRR